MKNKDEKIIQKSIKLFFDKFRCNKCRFITTFAITVFAFFCVNFSLSVLNFNQVDGALRTAYANDLQSVTLNCYCDLEIISDYGYKKTKSKHTFEESFKFNQLSRLRYNGANAYYVVTYQPWNELFYIDKDHLQYELSLDEKTNDSNFYSLNLFKRFIIVDGKEDEVKTNLCLQSAAENSRLPDNKSEIALTDFQASVFMKFGFIDVYGDGVKHEIKTYEDMLGKNLGEFTVVGVYFTEESCDYNNPLPSNDENRLPNYYINNHLAKWNDSVDLWIKTAFLSKEWMDDGDAVLYKLSGKFSEDKGLIKDLSYYEAHQIIENRGVLTYKYNYYIGVSTPFSAFEDRVLSLFTSDTVFARILLPLFIMTVVIIALILLNKLFGVIFGLSHDNSGNGVCDFCETRKQAKRYYFLIALIITLLLFVFVFMISFIAYLIVNVCSHYYWLQINLSSIVEFFFFVIVNVFIATFAYISKINKAIFVAIES